VGGSRGICALNNGISGGWEGICVPNETGLWSPFQEWRVSYRGRDRGERFWLLKVQGGLEREGREE
jgi:hypothetical protein